MEGPGYVVGVSRRAALILLLSLAAASCGVPSRVDLGKTPSGPASRTFSSHGISFQYPGNWVAFDSPSPDPQQDATQRSQDVVGLDDLNIVSVTELSVPQADQGLSAWSNEMITRFADAFVESGIDVKSGPQRIRLAGAKGLRWNISQPSGVGYVLDTTLVVMFRRDSEYFIRCQHTRERAPEMNRGCDQVLASFRFGGTEP